MSLFFSKNCKPTIYKKSDIDTLTKEALLQDFQTRIIDFFDTKTGKMPKSFPVAEIIVDEPDEAAVVVLDTRKIRSFGE